jgi:UDP-N-acetylglucosamine diphosphorylase/glucosamine-1-phosphate N-acetyltransferase
MAIVIIEPNEGSEFHPISLTRMVWDIRAGAFTFRERFEKQFGDVRIYSSRFGKMPWSSIYENIDRFAEREGINGLVNAACVLPFDFKWENGVIYTDSSERMIGVFSPEMGRPDIEAFAENDTAYFSAKYKKHVLSDALLIGNLTDIVKKNPAAIELDMKYFSGNGEFHSPKRGVYIHDSADVQEFTSLQPGESSIVIDKRAKVRPFSIIDGPAYIGENALIDGAKIRAGTAVGRYCRIGGEVEESVIEDYSNKHHEGFIGHSYIGSWVNIGAIATTSDLKNNYGNIRLEIDGRTVETGVNKFGSVICDYTKIGIGMMLNTGTVIAPGCNLFQEYVSLPKYIPPFSWGSKGIYDRVKFIEDLRRIMKRRGHDLTHSEELIINNI